MEVSTIKNLDYYIWLELNNGEWPDILFDIKPSNWDSLDFGSKGRLVLANYEKIHSQISAFEREYEVWLELNNGKWPNILLDIKPSNWDALDFGSKGELILDNYAEIHSHVSAFNSPQFNPSITNYAQEFQTKQQLEAIDQI